MIRKEIYVRFCDESHTPSTPAPVPGRGPTVPGHAVTTVRSPENPPPRTAAAGKIAGRFGKQVGTRQAGITERTRRRHRGTAAAARHVNSAPAAAR
jgi:hypothetical protein